MDLFEEAPGTTDSNGIVHEIFCSYLDDLVEKTVSLMHMQRSKTMLPRHEVSPDAIRLLLMVATTKTIAHLRSAAGLVSGGRP